MDLFYSPTIHRGLITQTQSETALLQTDPLKDADNVRISKSMTGAPTSELSEFMQWLSKREKITASQTPAITKTQSETAFHNKDLRRKVKVIRGSRSIHDCPSSSLPEFVQWLSKRVTKCSGLSGELSGFTQWLAKRSNDNAGSCATSSSGSAHVDRKRRPEGVLDTRTAYERTIKAEIPGTSKSDNTKKRERSSSPVSDEKLRNVKRHTSGSSVSNGEVAQTSKIQAQREPALQNIEPRRKVKVVRRTRSIHDVPSSELPEFVKWLTRRANVTTGQSPVRRDPTTEAENDTALQNTDSCRENKVVRPTRSTHNAPTSDLAEFVQWLSKRVTKCDGLSGELTGFTQWLAKRSSHNAGSQPSNELLHVGEKDTRAVFLASSPKRGPKAPVPGTSKKRERSPSAVADVRQPEAKKHRIETHSNEIVNTNQDPCILSEDESPRRDHVLDKNPHHNHREALTIRISTKQPRITRCSMPDVAYSYDDDDDALDDEVAMILENGGPPTVCPYRLLPKYYIPRLVEQRQDLNPVPPTTQQREDLYFATPTAQQREYANPGPSTAYQQEEINSGPSTSQHREEIIQLPIAQQMVGQLESGSPLPSTSGHLEDLMPIPQQIVHGQNQQSPLMQMDDDDEKQFSTPPLIRREPSPSAIKILNPWPSVHRNKKFKEIKKIGSINTKDSPAFWRRPPSS